MKRSRRNGMVVQRGVQHQEKDEWKWRWQQSSLSQDVALRAGTAIQRVLFKKRMSERLKSPELKMIKKNTGDLSTVTCTACAKQVNARYPGEAYKHPVLQVLICKRCYKYYRSGEISQDSNGTDEQCRWCGEGGDLLCCDACSNAFCKACIRRNLGRSELSQIMDSGKDWQCYVCNPDPLSAIAEDCCHALEGMAKKQNLAELQEKKGNVLPGDNVSLVKCTACAKQINTRYPGEAHKHPVLQVLICKGCYKYYRSGEISQDSNGTDEQCRWCGEGGDLLCCDACSNAFCKACIRRNLGLSELSQIMDSGEDWHCYVCNPEPLEAITKDCIRACEGNANEQNPEELQEKNKKGDSYNVTCTACAKKINTRKPGAAYKHPVLQVLICKGCYKYYRSGEISQDSDGMDEQCRWCGEGGDLLCCDACSNAFCKACIRRNLGLSELSHIMDSGEDWHCYVCNPEPLAAITKDCTHVFEGMAKEPNPGEIQEKNWKVNLSMVICTACAKRINARKPGEACRHPVLQVLICKGCYKYYRSGEISQDSNGMDEQCRWCGEGGDLLCCDACSNAFCKACIRRNLGLSELSHIMDSEDQEWQCYVCNPEPLSAMTEDCSHVFKEIENMARRADLPGIGRKRQWGVYKPRVAGVCMSISDEEDDSDDSTTYSDSDSSSVSTTDSDSSSVSTTDSEGDECGKRSAYGRGAKKRRHSGEDLPGKLVWGKVAESRPWPAMIIRGSLIHKKPATAGCHWLFWFGRHEVSQIPASKTTEFVWNFLKNYRFRNANLSRTFKESVTEAISICYQRSRKQLKDDTDNTLLEWALSGFPSDPSDKQWTSGKQKKPTSGHAYLRSGGKHQVGGFTDSLFISTELTSEHGVSKGGSIPNLVLRHVKKISEKLDDSWESSEEVCVEEMMDEYRGENVPHKDYLIRAVRDGNVNLDDICIACDRQETCTLIDQHPFFKGGLCCFCKDRLLESVFVMGDNGAKAFCTVCSKKNRGKLKVCSEVTCGRVYCDGCIEMLVGPDAVTELQKQNPWKCYLCEEYNPVTHGLLERRPGWRERLLRLFSFEPIPQMLTDGRKRPIRVLSLFDGIATGRFVLGQLGIEVEKYFACEIDPAAIAVSRFHFGDSITQLGDVRLLKTDKIASLGQIDLLIGGSPCQDLTNLNPKRKGLFDGTGKMFFSFLRVLNTLKKKGNVFWLFENVANMEIQTKDSITGFFGCQPAVWNAGDFSCQKRKRNFWGNIPGLQSPLRKAPREDANCTLQDVLTPNFNRRALVEKVNTVTTASSSTLQKKYQEFPIEMGMSGDKIWIQEVERIFGFPPHYTDVCNFSLTKRHALLGNSWSVPVVKHLLSPLKDFFLWKPQKCLQCTCCHASSPH